MKGIKNKFFLLFFLALIALYVVIYILPRVSGLFNITYPAKYGEITIFDEQTAFIVRTETVYVAAARGNVERLVQEGRKVRVGTPVVQVSGDIPEDYTAPDALNNIKKKLGDNVQTISDYRVAAGGLLSFHVDGYEAFLTPERAAELKEEDFTTIPADAVQEPDKEVKTGYPVFKVVNDGFWQIVTFVPASSGERYEEGKQVKFLLNPSDKDAPTSPEQAAGQDSRMIAATVMDVRDDGDRIRLILEGSNWFDGCVSLRTAKIRLVTREANGLLIEHSSLVTADGQKGVYIKDKKGDLEFLPVSVLADDGKQVAIYDSYYYDEKGERIKTVDPFDDVVRKPPKEGKDVYKG